jgi:pimeloyl-ACP methyl ester carboxylesterase
VKSYPVFVPSGADHLSGIVAVPDGAPHALVVFPLRAAPHGLRGSFWERAACLLAAEEIASVRFEYQGSGDSTGEWIPARPADAAEGAVTVAEVVMDALGLGTFAIAGSCFNGAVALAAAGNRRCIAAVSIDTPSSETGTAGRVRRRVAQFRIVDAVRTRPALRRAVGYDFVRSLVRDPTSRQVAQLLAAQDRTARVLLVHDERRETRDMAGLPGAYEVRRDISFGAIRIDGSELTRGEEQVLDAVVEWLSAAVMDAQGA